MLEAKKYLQSENYFFLKLHMDLVQLEFPEWMWSFSKHI